jgi:predicted transglutaminase-like cysteine proteinase
MQGTALASIARCSAAALALAVAPAPGQAQASSYYNAGKTEAILGGQSRLAAIHAQQSGQPIPQPRTVVPADYGAPAVRAAMPVGLAAAASDRPDVFGSVALPIAHTSLDYRWRKVARSGVGAVAAAYAAGLSGRGDIERVEAVNRYVNSRVRFVSDSRLYRTADHWSPAAETLRLGKGDCEDYAIAKLQMLRRAGFADRDLYLVILKDLGRRADHAVLVVRADGRLLVLDNGTDRLIDSAEIRDYRPIMTFSAGRAWAHGYRRETPPMLVATASAPAPAVTMAAASLTPVIPSTLR